mmetsp:Transcript_96249/g.170942  ORF Transcript_96249/g.170942 Transcript_96249/m.170942 type:complete len:686 (+) Transcript_96249:64-2121(+)
MTAAFAKPVIPAPQKQRWFASSKSRPNSAASHYASTRASSARPASAAQGSRQSSRPPSASRSTWSSRPGSAQLGSRPASRPNSRPASAAFARQVSPGSLRPQSARLSTRPASAPSNLDRRPQPPDGPPPRQGFQRRYAIKETVPWHWPNGEDVEHEVCQVLASLSQDQAASLVADAFKESGGHTDSAASILRAATRGAAEASTMEDWLRYTRSLASSDSKVTIYSDHGSGPDSDEENFQVGTSTMVQYRQHSAGGRDQKSESQHGFRPQESLQTRRQLRRWDDSSDEEDLRSDMERLATWAEKFEETAPLTETTLVRRAATFAEPQLSGTVSIKVLGAFDFQRVRGGPLLSGAYAAVTVGSHARRSTGVVEIEKGQTPTWEANAFDFEVDYRFEQDRYAFIEILHSHMDDSETHFGEARLQLNSLESQHVHVLQLPLSHPTRNRRGCYREISIEVTFWPSVAPDVVVLGPSEALCTRSKPLASSEAKQSEVTWSMNPEKSEKIDARCWKYLENRHEALKIFRRERNERIMASRRARGLADDAAEMKMIDGSKMLEMRIREKRADEIHRILSDHFETREAELSLPVLSPAELRVFLRLQLRISSGEISDDDVTVLAGVLLDPRSGRIQLLDFLDFVERGTAALRPAKVIFAHEERARELLLERFEPFFRRQDPAREPQHAEPGLPT